MTGKILGGQKISGIATRGNLHSTARARTDHHWVPPACNNNLGLDKSFVYWNVYRCQNYLEIDTQTIHCHAKLKQQKMPKRPIFLALSPPAHSRQKGMILLAKLVDRWSSLIHTKLSMLRILIITILIFGTLRGIIESICAFILLP